MRRSYTAILTAVVLSAVSAADLQAQPAGAKAPGVVVYEANPMEIADRIEALGTLKANETVRVTATVTEKLTAIHFDDGQRVEKEAVLVEMTSDEEHAQLEEARATLEEAQQQFKRIQTLVKTNAASRALLDEQRRELETARARLQAVESRLSDRLIKAPFAGVVGLRNISVGALVEPGDVITTLYDDSVMKLDFQIPATFLTVIREGLPITARARAYGDREFQGVVKSINAEVDPVTRSITVRAEIPNPDGLLKPGVLMSVELFNHPRESLVIPEEALIPQGDAQYLLIVDEAGMVERRPVRIGIRQPGNVEILKGLKAGERVITRGAMQVRPGQEVSIRAVDDGDEPLTELLDAGEAGSLN